MEGPCKVQSLGHTLALHYTVHSTWTGLGVSVCCVFGLASRRISVNLGTGRGWRELPSTPRRGAKWNLDGKPFERDAIPPAEAQFLLPTTLPARMANPVRAAGGRAGPGVGEGLAPTRCSFIGFGKPIASLGAGPAPRRIRIALSRHLTHCRTAPPVG